MCVCVCTYIYIYAYIYIYMQQYACRINHKTKYYRAEYVSQNRRLISHNAMLHTTIMNHACWRIDNSFRKI